MPTDRAADFFLDGKPFMLLRREDGGRSWRRTGRPDTPTPPPPSSDRADYGGQPEQIEWVETWDDWSGGFGDAYRDPERPNTYHWGENIDFRFPRQGVHCQGLIQGATTSATFNIRTQYVIDTPPKPAGEEGRVGAADILRMGDQYVSSLTPNGPTLDGSQFVSLGDTLDDRVYGIQPAVFASYTYIPVITASGSTIPGFRVRQRNAAFLTDAPFPARGFVNAGPRLWKWFGDHAARNFYVNSMAVGGSYGNAADWSATLTVGNGQHDIRAGIALEDRVYFGLADGLYGADTAATFFNVLPELRQQQHLDNCRDLTVHQGGIVVPHIGGIHWFRQGKDAANISIDISPGGRSNRSPVRGWARAVRGFGPWLLAGYWTGSQSWLLAGYSPEPGRYVWHTQQRLPDVAKVNRVHVDSITTSSGGLRQVPNRLWVATDATIEITGTAPIYWAPIPRGLDNPLAPDPVFTPSANYVGSARFDLGAIDRGVPGTPKTFKSLEVWADNYLSGYRYADVYYAVDDGARTLLGRAQVSPKTTLNFPAGVGSFVTGQTIAISIESFAASANQGTTQTPVYRAINLRGVLGARSIAIIEADVLVADNMRDRRRNVMRPAAEQIRDLRAMAATVAPYQLIDPTGAVNWVKVLSTLDESEVYQQGKDYPEITARVRMAVMDFSAA